MGAKPLSATAMRELGLTGAPVAYREVDESMRRAIEVLAETAALMAELGPDKLIDALAIERVVRRTTNAGAQLELDRRLIAEIRGHDG